MAEYNINPVKSMGGVVKEQNLNELLSYDSAPHYNWVEQLRLATDFITPDNTLICVADHWLAEKVTKVTPLGMTQNVNVSESLPSTLQGEIGSRRKRAMIGSSAGGSIGIARMLVQGNNVLSTMSKYGKTLGIDKNYWTEKEWAAAVGLNLDKLRTPVGIVIIDGDPIGRSYSCTMYEQCVPQGVSKGYGAGQFMVVENLQLMFEQAVPLWENEDTLNSRIESF